MQPTLSASAAQSPEQGQIIHLRKRYYLVQDVIAATVDGVTFHRLLLECLDDDQLGQPLSVIWEHEIRPRIVSSTALPTLESNRWDSLTRFQAYVHAVTWSATSAVADMHNPDQPTLLAPFHAAIAVADYQLEPVAQAVQMPRVNLLIADDVGLGKTIEAGLVMQEMLARQRVRRILVVCPASLQRQWQDEMVDKFKLDFRIIDSAAIQTLRREYGLHVNPWDGYPRLITSMDFLKRDQPLRLFQESLQPPDRPAILREWDLLVLDEAHNIAPSGRTHYIHDSDRTHMMRSIVDHFEHRLFLTATPHNGYTESFTALLEILDPLRFARSTQIDPVQVRAVMIRRLKSDIQTALGGQKFASRTVVALDVDMRPAEHELYRQLDEYTGLRLATLTPDNSFTVQFALTLLKKRFLSSPLAFANSIQTHLHTLGSKGDVDTQLLLRLQERAGEDMANDTEKAQAEEDALAESSAAFTTLSAREQTLVDAMATAAERVKDAVDSKATVLLDWIAQHMHTNGAWNGERLIIFTEYRDSLTYMRNILATRYAPERVLTLLGGADSETREAVKKAFQESPEANPVRILLATDAASEGLNLQNHCRYLIHWEIP